MIIEKMLSMLTGEQLVRLLIDKGMVQPETVSGVENKGKGIYSFAIAQGGDLFKRYVIKIEAARIRLMGSYNWRGYC